MSEPGYGSGPAYDPQQGYGGTPQYGQQQYGGGAATPGQSGQPAAGGGPYGTGQQPPAGPQSPQSPYGGSYGQQPGAGGYPSGSYQAAPSGPGSSPFPRAPQTPADRLGLTATILTIVGYVCAGAGVLAFILLLAADGDGTYRFAGALQALVLGVGLGGVNLALGTWLANRDAGH